MKPIMFVLPVFLMPSACDLLANSVSPAPMENAASVDETLEINDIDMSEGVWDGSLLLCGETINFDKAALDPLPEFGANERMGFCARTIKYLALNRQYGEQTTFFGVSAEITGTYAILNAPFMRRVYSRTTWKFIQQMNLSLDKAIDSASAELAAGAEGGEDFTRRIAEQQQADIQQALDALQAESETRFAKVLSDLDGTHNPTNPLLVQAIESEPFFSAYEAVLAAIRADVGRNVDFTMFDDRLKIVKGLSEMLENLAKKDEEPEGEPEQPPT